MPAPFGPATLGLVLAWLAVCTAVATPAHAQTAGPVAKPETPLSPETYQLAERPLDVPRTEITFGALLLTALPVMYSVALMQTFDLTSCEDDLFGTGPVDEQCVEEERHQAQQDEHLVRNLGIASGVLGVLGVTLVVDGIVRAVRIQKARSKVTRFQHAALYPARHGAALSLSLTF